MLTEGIVREWHSDEGWGVLDSPATAGGCWAHFSAVQMPGYRELEPSAKVLFIFEPVSQDGYSFRALSVRRIDGEAIAPQAPIESSVAYTSTLVIHDPEDDSTVATQGSSMLDGTPTTTRA